MGGKIVRPMGMARAVTIGNMNFGKTCAALLA